MEEKYLYLTLDIAAISLPLAFSFYSKANFSKKWIHLWPAILIPAALFLIWDEWFTVMGVWGFNPRYLSGHYLFSLPIEEVLFFICIPYACVFTYEAVGYFSKRSVLQQHALKISILLIIISLGIALFNADKWYTVTTFIGLAAYLAFVHLHLKSSFIGQFYVSYLFILIPFFLINGILTGTGIEDQVVWYNNEENLGLRMGTIPIEDAFYGMLLILMNVSLFEMLQKKSAKAAISVG